jgi:hypothetical protein
MIYKFSLQLFRILLGFRNKSKSTYFYQNQRAFRQPWMHIHIRYAYVTSKVKSEIFILHTTCHYQYETRFLVLN